ncbi:cupin domain-containing protein [Thiosulfativibrio zosterae]|uniref:Cupin n=1 Tax=Thiosulfativibrio zosterae TaxID=2675053 RepID=A0A6F8PP30_9GAMM|nr:cupin domain-containing protein [Thiosulfativibrio zosterae]BBP43797.1 cupin [Thiosulfativibrio zosterae]
MTIHIQHQPSQDQLQTLGVFNWPIWEKESSAFDWFYDAEETCYLLEGQVVVSYGKGEAVSFGAGDLVTFPKGLTCRWDIQKAVKKHYQFA